MSRPKQYLFRPTGAGDGDATSIKTAGGRVYAMHMTTLDATPVWVKLYDKATAPSASDTPLWVGSIPANATATLTGTRDVYFPDGGLSFTNGIAIRATVGIADNDSTEVTTAENVIDVLYE